MRTPGIAIGLELIATAAMAETTCHEQGDFTYCQGSDGSSVMWRHDGEFESWNGTVLVRDKQGNPHEVHKSCQRNGERSFCTYEQGPNP